MSKPRWWVILPAVALLLLLGVFLIRESLQRAVIAVSVYRAHIFRPPPRLPGESGWHRLHEETQF